MFGATFVAWRLQAEANIRPGLVTGAVVLVTRTQILPDWQGSLVASRPVRDVRSVAIAMKIGMIANADNTNWIYRAAFPLTALEGRGHELAIAQPDVQKKAIDLSRLDGCDVVHIYRRCEPDVLKVVEVLRSRGVGIVWDNDDDLRLTPQGTPMYKQATGMGGRYELRAEARMRSRADLVTTTSEALADLYRQDYDGPIEVIENFLGSSQFAAPRDHEGIVIGWTGRREHDYDARVLRISDVLRRVMERDARVRVETIGVRLELPKERYRWTERTSLGDLSEIYRTWDLGIAPIADHPMNHARSNIKVKEYAAAGVPWLASARGPYLRVWSSKCGGILVEDDERWEETILDVIGSRKLKKMRKRVRSWGQEQAIDRHATQWEHVFELAAEHARSRLVAA